MHFLTLKKLRKHFAFRAVEKDAGFYPKLGNFVNEGCTKVAPNVKNGT